MSLVLAALLALPIGLSLGLLGGGGSILTVPLLVYVLGVEPKAAIATSLFVVGVTSLAALLPHARAGAVRWRTGLVFGGAGMVGAYLAGHLADAIPGRLLLILFAALMLATAVAMLWSRAAPERKGMPRAELAVRKAVLDGLVVGALTGLVGAGGGFLVVPALAMFGGLPMRAAAATSLVVIAMKSFAGFSGYLGHQSIDWGLALVVSGVAVAGSLVGARLAGRLAEESLRRGFGAFVLVVGVGMLGRELLQGGIVSLDGVIVQLRRVMENEFVRAALGGALIGISATLMMVGLGRVAGITGIAHGVLRPVAGDLRWRVAFLGALVVTGAVLAASMPGGFAVTTGRSAAAMAIAGLLVGFGARLGGGCTSGHGVCGLSRLSKRSLIAVVTFVSTGMLTVWVTRLLTGGV